MAQKPLMEASGARRSCEAEAEKERRLSLVSSSSSLRDSLIQPRDGPGVILAPGDIVLNAHIVR